MTESLFFVTPDDMACVHHGAAISVGEKRTWRKGREDERGWERRVQLAWGPAGDRHSAARYEESLATRRTKQRMWTQGTTIYTSHYSSTPADRERGPHIQFRPCGRKKYAAASARRALVNRLKRNKGNWRWCAVGAVTDEERLVALGFIFRLRLSIYLWIGTSAEPFRYRIAPRYAFPPRSTFFVVSTVTEKSLNVSTIDGWLSMTLKEKNVG